MTSIVVSNLPALPESAAELKVAPLIQTGSLPVSNPAPRPPRAAPPLPPPSTVTGPITILEKPVPPALASAPSTSPSIRVEGGKPALRPPVLPNRSLAQLKTPEFEPLKSPVAETPPLPVEKPVAETPPLPVEKPVAEAPALPVQSPEVLAVKAVEKPAVVTPAIPSPAPVSVPAAAKAPLPPTRAARAKKRRLVGTVIFYFIFAVTLAVLYLGGTYFGQETRVEGQVIPPPGMTLGNEVWIVTDFSPYASGIADDLVKERTPDLQLIQERQDHVQRAQADVASREERIRLLQEQIQAAKDESGALVKQAHDAAQQIWDGPGAQLEDEYKSRESQLGKAIADRAKSLNLKYQPDDTYHSPEVWANAYRLALYEVVPGVDGVKEHQWLGDQMKQWRDFLKTLDDRKEQLREQAAQIKLAPAGKIADLNSKIDELQHRIEATTSEEGPIKAELQQAQGELAQVRAHEAALDDKYYKQLYSLPEGSITERLPVAPNGRFSWPDLEKNKPFAEGEKEHHYWIFARATRADGRQYWALGHFSIAKNHVRGLFIEPDGFKSTKAYLRPELSPDEQAQ